MNYSIMTDSELLHYLDLYSNDPLIRRLVDLMQNTRGEVIRDLVDAGMDSKTWTFNTDYETMYPGEYIESLRSELRCNEQDMDDMRYEMEKACDERDELKARNIMQFIEEVQQEKRAAAAKAQAAYADVANIREESSKVKKENEKLREQINMWGRMNTV